MWDLKNIDVFELQEFLIAKFTHDLAGVLGAVDNSIDFLNDKNPETRNKAISLLKDSSAQSIARLKFYRVAFGNVPNSGEADIPKMLELTNDYFKGSKIKFSFADDSKTAQDMNISPALGKLIMNLIIICSHNLIYGGDIKLTHKKDGNIQDIVLKGEGKGIKFEHVLEQLLVNQTRENVEITSKTIQIFYSSIYAQHINASIEVDHDDNSISFHVQQICKN